MVSRLTVQKINQLNRNLGKLYGRQAVSSTNRVVASQRPTLASHANHPNYNQIIDFNIVFFIVHYN